MVWIWFTAQFQKSLLSESGRNFLHNSWDHCKVKCFLLTFLIQRKEWKNVEKRFLHNNIDSRKVWKNVLCNSSLLCEWDHSSVELTTKWKLLCSFWELLLNKRTYRKYFLCNVQWFLQKFCQVNMQENFLHLSKITADDAKKFLAHSLH